MVTIWDQAEVAQTSAKRGRKAQPPDPDKGPLAAFAHELWLLKRRAGDPSFATMCTRLGAAASKSSLAAATRGTVLPSWETTWEFVRVLAVEQLGADEQDARRDWLARWTAAGGATDPAGTVDPAPADPADPAGTVEPAPADPDRPGKRIFRPTRNLAAVACALLVVVVVGLSSLAAAPPDHTAEEQAAASGHTGAAQFDDAVFEGDVTFPDGSVVAPGRRFTKVWQLRNYGSTRWEGRYLTRVNSTPCQTPDMVPIPVTDPGEPVRIEVPVTASESPARCKIYFKMTDDTRRLLLPDRNPIFLDVAVQDRV